jgi:hypothetical protein
MLVDICFDARLLARVRGLRCRSAASLVARLFGMLRGALDQALCFDVLTTWC